MADEERESLLNRPGMQAADKAKADKAKADAEARAKADAEAKAKAAAEAKSGDTLPETTKQLITAFVHAQKEVSKPSLVTRTEDLDKAKIPGGLYLVDGKYVDHEGVEVAIEDEPEDKDDDPLYQRFHPKDARAKRQSAPADSGDDTVYDQFGNPVEVPNEKPIRRVRRI